MADVVDIAQDLHGAQHERNIQEIRKAASVREIEPAGECHFCYKPFPKGDKRVFCDSACAIDDERLKRNKR